MTHRAATDSTWACGSVPPGRRILVRRHQDDGRRLRGCRVPARPHGACASGALAGRTYALAPPFWSDPAWIPNPLPTWWPRGRPRAPPWQEGTADA